jgi:tetratricopeptide (TPR) repeat protein
MKPWLTRWRDELRGNGHALALVAILGLAAMVRLIHLITTAHQDPYFDDPAVDPAIYLAWAKEIVAGTPPKNVFFLSPGYPYFLAVLLAIVGDDLFALRAFHAFLGWCGVGLVYLLGRRAMSPRAGLAAAGLAAVYAPLVFYEQELLPAAIQGPLSSLACLMFLWAGDKQRPWIFGLCGLCLGLASTARPNLLVACAFVTAWFLWRLLRHRSDKGPVFQGLCAFVLGCALPIAPATYHNLRAGDAVLISAQGGHNFYIGNGPDATGRFVVPRLFSPDQADDPKEQERIYKSYAEHKHKRELRPSEVSAFYYELTWEYIVRQPHEWWKLMGRKLLLLVNDYEASSSRDFDSSRRFSAILTLPLLTAAWLFPLALVGIGLAAWRGPRLLPLLFVLGAHLASALAFFTLAHYRVPATPLLCVFAALTVLTCIEAVHTRHWKYALVLVVFVGLSAGVVNLRLDNPEASRFMVHYNLGNRFRKQGNCHRASKEYQESLRLQPLYLPARNNLALCLENMPKKTREAIDQWRLVLDFAQERGSDLYIERARRHLLLLEQADPSLETPREDR